MKYSYIKPRSKSFFTPAIKLSILFFIITIGMLFSTYMFLFLKDFTINSEKNEIVQKRAELTIAIEKMKEDIVFIEKEILLGEKITTQNMVLKDSISNLFDLVPQRITLSEASLLETGLILYGITPNKDTFEFMLQAPLRSIFHKSYSSFYPISNGWLRFVSTNYMQEDAFEKTMYSSKVEDKVQEDEDED